MPRTNPAPRRESSPQRTVLAAIQARSFSPVYYLYGDDDFLKEAALRELLDAAVDPSTRDFNCETRRGGDLDPEAVNDVLGTPPMLAERRAVIIRDVGTLKKGARAMLDKFLARPASDTMLLLTTPAGGKVDAALVDSTDALHFEPLSPERVRKWITHQAQSVLGAHITNEATELLQRGVGNDLQALAGELDKCASYVLGTQDDRRSRTSSDARSDTALTNPRRIDAGAALANAVAAPTNADALRNPLTIDADAVTAVVGIRPGYTMTDLLDAVARHDAATAMKLIPHVLAQPKVTGVGIVISLSAQAFALAYGRARREAGVPTGKLPAEFFSFLKETGAYPGRPWGEAASAWTKQVDGWSSDSCARALELLLDADIALKETMLSDAEQTLTTLILALCALKPRGRRAA